MITGDMQYLKREFVTLLEESVEPVDAILLSGGLDTSTISHFLKDANAITVCFEECPDLRYAKMIAKGYGMEHHIIRVKREEVEDYARDVIRILRSFDPAAVRNGIPIYLAMRYAKDNGFRSVATGDGGDELFAGYSFLLNKPEEYVETWIRKIVKIWHFDSQDFAKYFGLRISSPYLNQNMVNFAVNLPARYKIGVHNGVKYGKYIVRLAMEKYLGDEIVWREKNPIEVGSGFSAIGKFMRGEPVEGIKLWNEEHYLYYRIFMDEVGEIPEPKNGEYPCPVCGAGIKKGVNHCRVCGWYSGEM